MLDTLKQLSYSSSLTLHSCPRKYQLTKSGYAPDFSESESVTFAFGHAVGAGLASVFCGHTEEQTLWEMYKAWDFSDLFGAEENSKKSFSEAVFAVDILRQLVASGLLSDYKVFLYNGKEAVELGFKILMPNGFTYRGYMDIVLQNIHTGDITIVECKTTGMYSVDPMQYKNSAQALGYSLVLSHLFPDAVSYEVLYLVYGTRNQEWIQLPFVKTISQRTKFIKNILLDMESIIAYDADNYFPPYGESCFGFNRPCYFADICDMKSLATTQVPPADDKEYDIVIDLQNIISGLLES